ncbi:hypothetical protein C2857_000651 [Epichloe festucae Fl1]|uniref:Carboxylic ester hydrolase n=1 Tax=Epichloe festucae (strain Fl1) TaxID=877507 RepID=A0A7S9KU63_EPIFF|nr:hypothetical protein C2857_000651 [Epichloe festucae Fl1]
MKLSYIQLPILHAALIACIRISPPTATVVSGPIFGAAADLPGAPGPVNKFLGIPYAEKPERFALPQPPRKWKDPKDATAFGSSCHQLAVTIDVGPDQDLVDYLRPPGGRAVVLFFHGGGWSLSNGLFDLSGFAGYEDIVAFTFNYRTNIFGFPNAGDIPVGERNLGLFDQRLALQWVQQNAKAFGGDPSKVTVWGLSAGSLSIDILMHAYAGVEKPPFRGAIMSSGEYSFSMWGFAADPRDTSQWDNIAKAAGCNRNKIQCLRELSPEKLLDAAVKAGARFMPIQDNKAVPSGRATAWRQGKVAKVPLLAGTTAQEGRSLVNPHISLEKFDQVYLAAPLVTKQNRDAIYEYYRKQSNVKSNFELASMIYTDLLWQCPMRKLTTISSSINNPTWRYYFNISMTEMLPEKYQFLGKFHGIDIRLLFGSPTYHGSSSAGGLYTPVLSRFLTYWRGAIGKFVRDPSGGPGWPTVGSPSAPFDIVSLGDVGSVHSAGATPMNQTEVDWFLISYKGGKHNK